MQAIYLDKIPIPISPFSVEALVTKLVDYLLVLSAQPLEGSKDALAVPFFEQLIDALVFELYLPDELHKAGRFPFETRSAETWPDAPNMDTLRSLFDRLYNPQHPIRKLVFFLDSIPEVQLIMKGTRGQKVGAVAGALDDE